MTDVYPTVAIETGQNIETAAIVGFQDPGDDAPLLVKLKKLSDGTVVTRSEHNVPPSVSRMAMNVERFEPGNSG